MPIAGAQTRSSACTPANSRPPTQFRAPAPPPPFRCFDLRLPPCALRRKCRAATLVESLFAALALAALLLTLLPALGEFRRAAKSVRCLDNLGRIAQAAIVHAALDPNERAVPEHARMGIGTEALGMYEWGGKSGMGAPVSGADPLNSQWGTQNGRGPATRPLNRILYGEVFPDSRDNPGPDNINWLEDTRLDLDAFRCPSDNGYSGHHYNAWRASRMTSYDHYGNSYASNNLWVGLAGGNCTLHSASPFLRPLSRVPNPAHTILLIENAGLFAWRKNYVSGACGAIAPPNTLLVRGWHDEPWTFNAAFSDGRAATVRMKGHLRPQPDPGRFPRFGSQNPSYNFWCRAIVRGPGWQLDALPGPAVPTSLNCFTSGAVFIPVGP